MKKLILSIVIAASLLTSCTTEENVYNVSECQSFHWEYYQRIGFKMFDNGFEVVTNDGQKILQAELFNVNTNDVYIYRPNDHTVKFYSTNEHLMNAGDTYYVNLKLAN